MSRAELLNNLDALYLHVRIARGWRLPVVGPMNRDLVVAPGADPEVVRTVVVAMYNTQAILDRRHAVN